MIEKPVGIVAFVGLAAIGGFLSSSAGCSDDTGTGGSDPCANEIGADQCFQQACVTPLTGTISFKTDVLPLFEQSCALSSSCHGNNQSPTGPSGYQPYLGEVNPETTPSDVDLIMATIVSQKSPTSALSIVEPGHPETSFLMHKMDGDVDCPDLGCTGGDCGDTMPQGSTPMAREARDKVRAWIQQGAKNN